MGVMAGWDGRSWQDLKISHDPEENPTLLCEDIRKGEEPRIDWFGGKLCRSVHLAGSCCDALLGIIPKLTKTSANYPKLKN